MVILNRIINILILLAAIAAGVFSYFLFSKRENLINGWAQMATAINTAAKTLDDGGASGTSAARDLPEEKLKHTNYEQLGVVLPKLKENVSKIITQRNDLSSTISNAATMLSIPRVEAKNLKSVTAYKDQERMFSKGVQMFRNNRDSIARAYAKTFMLFGAQVSVRDLNDPNPQRYNKIIDDGNIKVQDVLNQKSTYASYLVRIVRATGVPAPNVRGLGYKKELEKTLNAVSKSVRDRNNELKKTKDQLAREVNMNKRLRAELDAQSKSIKSLQARKRENESEIATLNARISRSGTLKIPKKWLTSKDPECYKYVKGVIDYIDKDYGFVTINIGKNYSFVQQYGTTQNRVLFPLPVGKTMTVVRNPDSANPLFIGKVIITKVEDNSSICNIISGKAELLHEGDAVFFTDEDIASKPNTAQK